MAAPGSTSRVFEEAIQAAAEGVLRAAMAKASFTTPPELFDAAASSLKKILAPIAENGDAGVARVQGLLDMAVSHLGATSNIAAGARAQSADAVARLPLTLLNLLSMHFDANDPAAKKDLEELAGLFKEINIAWRALFATPGIAAMAGGPGSLRDKLKIIRAMVELAKRLKILEVLRKRLELLIGNLKAPRFKKVLKDLEIEIGVSGMFEDALAKLMIAGTPGVRSLENRVLQALAFSAAGVASDVFQTVFGKDSSEQGSNIDIGNQVDDALQLAYRRQRFLTAVGLQKSAGYVLQDNLVYESPETFLDLVKLAIQKSDGSLRALVFARWPDSMIDKVFSMSPFTPVWSIYREDTFDLLSADIYEIKPLRSTYIGILQEFQYRYSFNLVHAAMQDLFALTDSVPLLKKSFFSKIGYFSVTDYAKPGGAAPWSGCLNTFRVNTKSGGGGEGRMVVPFTVPQFEGLVLYITIKSPALERLLLLSPLAKKAVQDAMEKLARRYAKGVEQVYDIALAAILALSAVVVLIMLCLLIEILLPAAAIEALMIGGTVALRRLIMLAPAAMLADFGLMPARGNPSDPASAIIDALKAMTSNLKMEAAFPPQFAGDKILLKFKKTDSPAGDMEGSGYGYFDLTLANVHIVDLPAEAVPLVKYLHSLGLAIAAGAFIQSIADQSKQPAPPPRPRV